jgi:general secretion pathway protein D
METSKPITLNRGRAALLATACLIAPLSAGDTRTGSSLAESEQARRSTAIVEARELLQKGDEAYQAARYADAVEAYAGARELIPNAPVSAELRAAATERYAQASVEHARVLSRKGDVAGAKAAVDKVLLEGVAPSDPGALEFRAQLNDPIRTNPALTAEHAKNVDEVRRLLYTAQGAFDLGKFGEANLNYEKVLRIDPSNTAARRGMEKAAGAKSDYQKSAFDQARAEMLKEVDAAWETKVPATTVDPSLVSQESSTFDPAITVANKINRIIIPRIALDQATLDEALEFLRIRAAENDTLELDPAKKGVNFTVNLGDSQSERAKKIRELRFDLRLSQVPLSQALKYITDMTQTSFKTDDFSVTIAPVGSASDEMVSRTYRVPPDFISNLSSGQSAEAADADPFATTPKEGLLATRMGVQEALAKQGVGFPDGSTASYSPATNTLRVINTEANQEYIAQIVEAVTQTEPVSIVVRVTMLKVEQTNLQELGFDWILDNFGFGGPSWIPGNAKYNLSGGTQGNGGDLSDITLPDGASTLNPITAGNRSGDDAISGNSIDSLIQNPAGQQANERAPGVFGVRGELSNASVQTLMRGLDQKKGVDMMAQPSVTTRSGQASSVRIVREFIYPTEYEPPELPNSVGQTGGTTPVTPATPTAFDKKDVGINLEVLPVADANKRYIDVTLNPTFTDFDGFVNYGSPINATEQGLLGPETVVLTPNEILMPVFSKQAVSTNVQIADGSTIVIGGLMREEVQNVHDQTPILGSVPVVGRLFQSTARKPISTAILFLVNVELLDPTGHPYRNR